MSEYQIINGNTFLVTVEDTVEEIIKSNGFFVSLGHLVTFPDFISNNTTMGIMLEVKYDYGKFNKENVGGVTFFMGVNFLIY